MKKIIASLSAMFLLFSSVLPLALPVTVQAQTAPGMSGYAYCFDNNMGVGRPISLSDATALTTILRGQGFWTSGAGITTYNDSVASAVSGLQEKYASQILTPNGLTYGTGYVGVSTRAELNLLAGCTPATSPVQSIQCPAGFTCTPINQAPAPFVCPIGYTCTPTSSNTSTGTIITTTGTINRCNNLNISNPVANSQVTFPLTVTGSVDTSCWSSFEGNIGTAQAYFYDKTLGWNTLGTAPGVQVQGGDTWPPGIKQFSVTLNFRNDYIGISNNTPIKVVFKNYSEKGDGSVLNQYELPLIFTNTSRGPLPSPISTNSPVYPSITINYPNGGETLQEGSNYGITWSSNNLPTSYLNIQLVDSFGNVVRTIVNNVSNNGYYSWTVPNDLVAETSGQFKIRITTSVEGLGAQDYSDNYFRITMGNQPVPSTYSPAPSLVVSSASLSIDPATPNLGTVTVQDATNGQYLALPINAFDIKALGSTLRVRNLTATILVPPGVTNTAKAAYLYSGTTLIASTIVSGNSATFNIPDGLEAAIIPVNQTLLFTIKIDISGMPRGSQTQFTSSVQGANVGVYNPSTNQRVTVNGNAYGNVITIVNSGTTAYGDQNQLNASIWDAIKSYYAGGGQ